MAVPGSDPDTGMEALAVLAAVVRRDGQEVSATSTRLRNLANADHLAILNAIWTAETSEARERRYRGLLTEALPPRYRDALDQKAKWLWRTLRAAELAGLDAQQVISTAVGERSLADALDVAAVIDSRIRRRTGSLIPQPTRSWSEQVPGSSDPDRRRYVAEIAGMMDARKERIGEHAAEHSPAWATAALRPVPPDPVDRLDWQARASTVGAYRELYGYDNATEPIGPEPIGDVPDKRAAWHDAFAVMRPARGMDVRGLPDGSLLQLRDTYPVETFWAPRWVGDQLRQVRRAADEAHQAAVLHEAETRIAGSRGDETAAARKRALARSYTALHDAYRAREGIFAGVMADRAAWERATARQRQLAVAADAELRRRHPGQPLAPLRSAEPPPLTASEHRDLELVPGQATGEISQWIKDLAIQREEFARELANRLSVRAPSEGLGWFQAGQPLSIGRNPEQDAILQPPKPVIRPSG